MPAAPTAPAVLAQLERDFLDADRALADALNRLARLGAGSLPGAVRTGLRASRHALTLAYGAARPHLEAAGEADESNAPF